MAKTSNGIKPIGEYILVEPLDEQEKTTASGLVIQSTSKGERPQKGKIVALGSGRVTEDGKTVKFNVEVGQTVMFKRYSPEEIEIDGRAMLLMKESDLLAILE